MPRLSSKQMHSSFQKFVSLVASTANSLQCGEVSLDTIMSQPTTQTDGAGKALSLQEVLGDITTSIRYLHVKHEWIPFHVVMGGVCCVGGGRGGDSIQDYCNSVCC